jgi:uncharacterized protein (DUF2236 family)
MFSPKADSYFPAETSIARRVHAERAVGVLYGQRALLIGALDPLTYTGTMQSTKSSNRPFQRLARTAKIHEAVLLGTREEADAALESVHRLHRRVEGKLPHAAGKHQAGARYSAFDPELMLWTLAVIADSARAVYETLIQPLSDADLEQLWSDYMLFGELFGLSRDAMPADYREFSAWMAERLASPDLHATPHALELAPLVAFKHPVPRAMRPGLHLNNLVIKGTLPERVRDIFSIRWGPLHESGFRAVAIAHRRVIHLLPTPIRRGRNDVFFDLVSRGERRLGGTASPGSAGD